jgi:sugar lactone lactonase YvrE
MKSWIRQSLFSLGLVGSFLVPSVHAADYTFSVIARNLSRPTGIAASRDDTLYFTQVPTPGIAGGSNSVAELDLESGHITVLHQGEPEPINIAVDREENLYWTCKTAGVILEQNEAGTTTRLLAGLHRPSGISVDRQGNVYFTEVPTPGVPGGNNGVSVFDGTTKTVLHTGEPEPTDIVVSRHGEIYWTCKSAGVILEQTGGVTTVLVSGLNKPTGIALSKNGRKLYFTEVPTPGVPGSAGGKNTVKVLNLRTKQLKIIHAGDPEPTDVTVARNGNVYWTCTSAGVIIEAKLQRRDEDED